MQLGEILQLVHQKLGEQHVFYPTEEVLRSGVNPAERLLCLAHPLILQNRYVTTVNEDQPFIDLRSLLDGDGHQLGHRVRDVTRVVIGDVSQVPPVVSDATGDLTYLRPVSIGSLFNVNPEWMQKHGSVRKYWQWGKVWLGLYKRPVATTTITIVFDETPVPMVIDDLTVTPSIQETYHTLIAEVAANLLLIKEGIPDGQRGLEKVLAALQLGKQ